MQVSRQPSENNQEVPAPEPLVEVTRGGITESRHRGEPIHTEVAASMLKKIGLESRALKCGTHEPFSQEAARRLRERGEEPNVLQNNCSGKHAGMLALALHLGAPT